MARDVTPADFGVTLRTEPRHPIEDSTFGVRVEVQPGPKRYSRRLVTLGDSLTQGFHHLAVHDTEISWPAIVAAQLGVQDFAFPTFPTLGGYPWNLEDILRLDDGGFVPSIEHVWDYVRQVKAAYAPTAQAVLPTPSMAPNDNLAVWGWDLRDLIERTVQTELLEMHDGLALARLLPEVDHAMHRTGITTLGEWRAPAGGGRAELVTGDTALELAAERGSVDDGIETLVVWIGSNNALNVVAKLEIIPSGPGYDDLETKRRRKYNLWLPTHFSAELAVLEAQVESVRAEHVLWGTVPHVTIPPAITGLGDRLTDNPRYFQYYGHPWQTDASFDPAVDAHLTGADAWVIDTVIDAYNDAICAMVTRQRQAGRDWRVVDFCAMLDRLAIRRNDESDGGTRPPYLKKYPLPRPFAGMTVRFFDADPAGNVNAGGLIGLDGVHPTTVGYSLVAHEVMLEMQKAGVVFPAGPTPPWAAIKAADTLLRNPPVHIDQVLPLLRRLNSDLDVLGRSLWDLP